MSDDVFQRPFTDERMVDVAYAARLDVPEQLVPFHFELV